MCGDCFGLLASSSGSLEKGVHIPTKEPDSTAPRKLSITSTDLTPQHKFNEISKVGWLLKREKKKFLVMSSERVFCLLKGGVLYYFRAQKATPKDCEQDPDYVGQTDLAGALCKMTIEASHRFGIEITCQNGTGQVIQFNAESHADQKHWFDAIQEQIEIANDAVLRAEGLANDGMKNWYEQKMAEQKAAIASLQKGRKMRKHYMAMGFHRMHDRLLCLDETGKNLMWCDPYASLSDRGEVTPTNSFPIADIVSVKIGAETVALSAFASSNEASARCFSILTAEKSYDFECDTRDQRDDFITQLNTVREHLEREEIKEEVSIKKKNEERRKGLRDSLQKSKNLIDGHKKPSATEMTKR